ncbi:MAG: hypothetical protein AAGB16_02210 [Pseudomonadota bacterium]
METVGWLNEQLQNLKLWRQELISNPCDQALGQVEQIGRHERWLESQLAELQPAKKTSYKP